MRKDAIKMQRGQVRITNYLIKEALKFPMDWEIEGIRMGNNPGESIMIISGPDFPEQDIHTEIPYVMLEITKKNIRFKLLSLIASHKKPLIKVKKYD